MHALCQHAIAHVSRHRDAPANAIAETCLQLARRCDVCSGLRSPDQPAAALTLATSHFETSLYLRDIPRCSAEPHRPQLEVASDPAGCQ